MRMLQQNNQQRSVAGEKVYTVKDAKEEAAKREKSDKTIIEKLTSIITMFDKRNIEKTFSPVKEKTDKKDELSDIQNDIDEMKSMYKEKLPLIGGAVGSIFEKISLFTEKRFPGMIQDMVNATSNVSANSDTIRERQATVSIVENPNSYQSEQNEQIMGGVSQNRETIQASVAQSQMNTQSILQGQTETREVIQEASAANIKYQSENNKGIFGFFKKIWKMLSWMKIIQIAQLVITTAISVALAVFSALMSPMVILTTAIVLSIIAIVLSIFSPTFRKWFVDNIITPAKEWLYKFFIEDRLGNSAWWADVARWALGAITWLWNGIVALGAGIWEGLKTIPFIKQLCEFFEWSFDMTKKVLSWIWDTMVDGFQYIWDGLKYLWDFFTGGKTATLVWDWIKGIPVLGPTMEWLANTFITGWGIILDGWKKIGSLVWDYIKDTPLGKGLSWIMGELKTGWKWLTGAIEKIAGVVGATIESVGSAYKGAREAGKGKLYAAGAGVGAGIMTALGASKTPTEMRDFALQQNFANEVDVSTRGMANALERMSIMLGVMKGVTKEEAIASTMAMQEKVGITNRLKSDSEMLGGFYDYLMRNKYYPKQDFNWFGDTEGNLWAERYAALMFKEGGTNAQYETWKAMLKKYENILSSSDSEAAQLLKTGKGANLAGLGVSGSMVPEAADGMIVRVAEAGSDEAIIPLNEQGASFMARTIKKALVDLSVPELAKVVTKIGDMSSKFSSLEGAIAQLSKELGSAIKNSTSGGGASINQTQRDPVSEMAELLARGQISGKGGRI